MKNRSFFYNYIISERNISTFEHFLGEAEEGKSRRSENSRPLDLFVCKNIVLSRTMQSEEDRVIYNTIATDRQEIRRSFLAMFVAQRFRNLTFTSMMPMIFPSVYIEDSNLNRVFHLLIVIAVMYEMMRSYVALLQQLPILDKYRRTKRDFVVVIGVDEIKLFLFPWKICR